MILPRDLIKIFYNKTFKFIISSRKLNENILYKLKYIYFYNTNQVVVFFPNIFQHYYIIVSSPVSTHAKPMTYPFGHHSLLVFLVNTFMVLWVNLTL